MSIIAPVSKFDEPGFNDLPFKRLSAAEALALRKLQPPVSPWRIVGWQVVMGLAVALMVWGVTGRFTAAWSAAYGALAVVLPGALFARGLTSQFSSISAVTAGFGFFVWEAVKIAVSVGMLFAAPQLVPGLEWLAMLIGLVVTLKVYWLALLMRPKRITD